MDNDSKNTLRGRTEADLTGPGQIFHQHLLTLGSRWKKKSVRPIDAKYTIDVT